MGSGQANTRTVLDPVVDLFQMLGGTAADLEHEVKLSGQIVAGNNIGIVIDMLNETVIEAGMLHADFHQDSNIISELMFIRNYGV